MLCRGSNEYSGNDSQELSAADLNAATGSALDLTGWQRLRSLPESLGSACSHLRLLQLSGGCW